MENVILHLYYGSAAGLRELFITKENTGNYIILRRGEDQKTITFDITLDIDKLINTLQSLKVGNKLNKELEDLE